MAQLLFFDENHEYTVDGIVLPSVSHILRFISRETYEPVTQAVLDKAAKRGTAVHKACEMLDKYGTVECDDEYVPYVQAYIKFLKEKSVKWNDIETRYYHPERMYAGTIDRYGIVEGQKTLLDIKTVSTVQKIAVKAQVNGYEDMRSANRMTPSESLCCLQLMPDGKYRLYRITRDMTEFDACYNLHMALSKKHERGKIE